MYNKIFIIVFIGLVGVPGLSQDHWPVDYRVDVLVRRMPAGNQAELTRMMESLEAWGEPAWNELLRGYTTDSNRYAYAIESFSRYASMADLKPAAYWMEEAMLQRIINTPEESAGFWWQQLAYTGGKTTLDSLMAWQNGAQHQAYLWPLAVTLVQKLNVNQCPGLKLESPALAGKLKLAAEIKLTPTQLQALRALVRNGDKSIRPAAKMALARQGRSEDLTFFSADLLQGQARWPLVFMQHLDATSAKTILINLTTQLLRSTSSTADKIQALTILAQKLEQDALPLLTKANSNKTVDLAALLTIAQSIPGRKSQDVWLAFFDRAKAADQAAIFSALGQGPRDAQTVRAIKDRLKATLSPAVQVAGWQAWAKLSGPECAQEILHRLLAAGPDNPEVQATWEQILERHADERVLDDWFKHWTNLSPAAKTIGMRLLARRPLAAQADLVWATINQPASPLVDEAWQAYPALVQPRQVPALVAWMKSLPERRSLLQAALQNVALPDGQKLALIASALQDGQPALHFMPVLQKIGNHASGVMLMSLAPVEHLDTLAMALAGWSDLRTTPLVQQVYGRIAESNKTAIWSTWLRSLVRMEAPADEKRLRLESWLPLLTDASSLGQALMALGHLKTYAGLWTIAAYLDHPQVKSEAAQAVVRNILPGGDASGGLYGTTVSTCLEKAISQLTTSQSGLTNQAKDYLQNMPVKVEQYDRLFNGRDLTGWQGLAAEPLQRMRMRADSLALKQKQANESIKHNWRVQDGMIIFSGHGNNLQTVKMYADFELLVDWRITKDGDSGIYLRGSPQVQIWDTARVDAGAQVGSGGLYNNQKNPAKPLMVADHAVGEWNTFKIRMLGEQVWVWLNGVLVADGVTLENYWDRQMPIFPSGFIELQAHGTDLAFKNLYIKELTRANHDLTGREEEDDFESLFNGRDLEDWIGNKVDYTVDQGTILVKPQGGGAGNLYTKEQYSDFVFRFEFQLTPGANNGIGIRAPLSGDAAYQAMEIQVLDNEHEIYKNLRPYQYHGSVYGIMPAKRGALKATGAWNEEEIYVRGSYIRVTLNGVVITEGDFRAAVQPHGAMDHQQHSGLDRKQGYIGFLGHGDELRFRNIRVKRL